MNDGFNFWAENGRRKLLDLKCGKCNLRPSELEMICDTMLCSGCKDLNLKEKNPYISHGVFPFLVLDVNENEERKLYLQQVKEFDIESNID